MRPDQLRVQNLLTDTVTLLCKNGLQYKKELKVQGLLGITLDDNDVFVVHIDKIFDDIQSNKTLMNSTTNESVKVSNIPPSSAVEDGEQESLSFFSSPLAETDSIQITNIPPSTTIGDYENVDGSYEQTKISSDVIPRREIIPIQTSIITKPTAGVSKRKAGSNPKKRPIGSARRKDSRSVKHRPDIYTTSYGVHVKDEQPDEILLNPKDDVLSAEYLGNDTHGTASPKVEEEDGEESMPTLDMYSMSDSSMTYKNLEEFDANSNSVDQAADNYGSNDAVDMIECLLYNEAADQSENTHTKIPGLYQKIHISGADDNAHNATAESLAGCSGWEEAQEASPSPPPVTQTTTAKSSNKSTSSPAAVDDCVTYSGVQRQDINESLVAQYRDLLEVAASQGDGYPCVECDQILKTRAIWMEHMKGVHMNRKYACPHCGETFKWRSSRKRHVLVTHSDDNDLAFRMEVDNLNATQEAAENTT